MSSHELPPSFRVRRSASGRRSRLRPKSLPKPSAPPVRFSPLQRLSIRGSGTKVAEHPRLDRPPPTGFLNLLASSSAPNLPALFHAGSALGVHPSELCSFRAAVRRLQRRCPLAVGMSFRPVRVAGGRRRAETLRRILRRPKWTCRSDAPRLQGFAPHESPPPRPGGLGRNAARGSLGIHPLQGFHPRR
jgi:hypothetical protein